MGRITHSELAKMLDGHNYEEGFTKYVTKIARDNKLIMLTAIGDDVLKFSGLFNEEADCFRGGDVFLKIEDGECVVYTKKKDGSKKVQSFWNEHTYSYSWKFLTLIPHSKFCIRRNNKKWCEAIIFSVDDV